MTSFYVFQDIEGDDVLLHIAKTLVAAREYRNGFHESAPAAILSVHRAGYGVVDPWRTRVQRQCWGDTAPPLKARQESLSLD